MASRASPTSHAHVLTESQRSSQERSRSTYKLSIHRIETLHGFSTIAWTHRIRRRRRRLRSLYHTRQQEHIYGAEVVRGGRWWLSWLALMDGVQ